MRVSLIILAVLCTIGGLLAIGGVNGVFGPVVNALAGGIRL